MNDTAKIEKQAADWIARKNGDRWTEQDQLTLDAWIADSTANRLAYLRLNSIWKRADRLSSLRTQEHAPTRFADEAATTAVAISPAVEEQNQFSPVAAANSPRWRVVAAVAVVAAFCGTALLRMAGVPDGRNAATTYATTIGKRQAVTLVDGSRLTLNTDTKMEINVGTRRRQVRLEHGEAYFEVAHDANRPFTVDVGNSRITVLGTKFSVKRNGDEVAVLVKEGRVKVETIDSPSATTATITRNDELIAANSSFIVAKKSEEQVVNKLSWRQGLLVFDRITLTQAAIEFNRYNDKKLVIADAEAGKIVLGGRFESNNVSSFAHLLHEGLGLNVEERADEIRVTR